MESRFRNLEPGVARKGFSPYRALVELSETVGRALYPHFCFGCGQEGKLLCDECRKIEDVRISGVFWCPACGTESPWGQACPGCRTDTEFVSAVSMAIYGQPLTRRLLQSWKYQSVSEAESLLLGLFGDFLVRNRDGFRNLLSDSVVVPVPLHPIRLAERGFNQAESIGRCLAESLGLEICPDLLRRRWQWHKQATISDEAKRAANASGTVIVRSRTPIPERIILVDDVMTTGATLSQCARELKRAGCREVSAITVLRG